MFISENGVVVEVFWDYLWMIILCVAFAAYLILLFAIISDIFRDSKTSGWIKAIWVIFLIVFPLLTALVYLIAKGDEMTLRYYHAEQQAEQAQEQYIRTIAGSTPATEIAKAKSLLDSGTITQEEFQSMKNHALKETKHENMKS